MGVVDALGKVSWMRLDQLIEGSRHPAADCVGITGLIEFHGLSLGVAIRQSEFQNQQPGIQYLSAPS